MHADITSATLLIKSWTEVHRGQPLTHPPIFHLPSPTISSHDNSNIPPFSSSNSAYPPSKKATITMKFSGPVIEKCLSQVQIQCPKATPFDLLVALFWSSIARLQEPSTDEDHKRLLSICIDSRNHGHPPIPYSYFGNAMHFSVLSVDEDTLLSGGVGQVSDYVHRHVARLLEGDNFWSLMNWLEQHSKEGDGTFRLYGQGLTCINMEHMADGENGEALMYRAVFDKGERPVHVSYQVGNVEGEGLIMVLPSNEAGLGRTVTVVLPEEQIAKLCKDQAILDLEPTMVINGRR